MLCRGCSTRKNPWTASTHRQHSTTLRRPTIATDCKPGMQSPPHVKNQCKHIQPWNLDAILFPLATIARPQRPMALFNKFRQVVPLAGTPQLRQSMPTRQRAPGHIMRQLNSATLQAMPREHETHWSVSTQISASQHQIRYWQKARTAVYVHSIRLSPLLCILQVIWRNVETISFPHSVFKQSRAHR